MNDHPHETEWIAAAMNGDRESLQQLLFFRCPSLQRYLGSQRPADLKTQIDVDDVLQDTLIAAVQGFSQFRGKTVAEFRSWLKTIAQHRLQDRVKQLTAQKRRGSPLAPSPPKSPNSSIANLAENLMDRHDSPSRFCGRREEIHAVRVALSHLPSDQRQAVQLRYVEGKSTDETALAMDCSPGAVRGLIQRARASLRKLLGTSSRWFSWR